MPSFISKQNDMPLTFLENHTHTHTHTGTHTGSGMLPNMQIRWEVTIILKNLQFFMPSFISKQNDMPLTFLENHTHTHFRMSLQDTTPFRTSL